MKNFVILAALFAATSVASLTSVQAQGGGMGGMRNSAKGRLSRVMRGIGSLEAEKKAALSPAQAKQVVLAVTPWQKKPRMSEAEAKALYMKINSVLTIKQKNELDKIAAKNRRFGGGSGEGRGENNRPRMGGGMGGFGGIGGGNAPDPAQMKQMRARMAALRGFMQTMNPFYPPSNYTQFKSAPDRMKQGMNRRYAAQQQMIAKLRAKAKMH